MLLEIAEQESIQSVLQPGASPVLANTSGVGWGGDEGLTAAEWSGMSVGEQEDWVRGNCFDCQHASGTCRMGQEDDPKTVVSSEVRALRPPPLPLLLHCSCLRLSTCRACLACDKAYLVCPARPYAVPCVLSSSPQNGAVHGLENLRVVDASLLPLTVRGNIHLTVLMLAEKLSDAIKAEYAAEAEAEAVEVLTAEAEGGGRSRL